jgi:hypothetical protein
MEARKKREPKRPAALIYILKKKLISTAKDEEITMIQDAQ